MNRQEEILHGDILIKGRQIAEISQKIDKPADEIFNAEKLLVIPGLIQTHVHLCQALFRNLADDLSLLDWLKKKIWPFEAAHTSETLRISARLALAELILSGTTTIMDMGTVNHQEVIFEELAASGMRAVAGKAMMDFGYMPSALKENTADSLKESLRLLEKWHNFDNGLLQYAFAPRFALSCSDELLVETGRMAKEHNVLYHTHAAENKDEVGLIKERFGTGNVQLFDKLGLADENLCLAHCIWTDEDERRLIAERNIKVLHCPSANLKLGSGIAPVPDYLNRGVTVSLGADGAPCNNNMNIFNEMRLAALIQKPLHGPQTMPAKEVFKMATINGARTLRIDKQTGSIEPGKLADLTFIKINQVHSIPYENIYSKIVYSTQAADVQHTLVNGNWLLKDRQLTTIDQTNLADLVRKGLSQLFD